MLQQNCQEETTNSRTHSKAGTYRKERRSQQRTSWWTGRVSTDRIHRWRLSPEWLLVNGSCVQLSSSQWTSSSIPLKYIDVTMFTTDLDVSQEKRTDGYWNINVNRHLSDSWKGITKFTLLKEKPSQGTLVVWWEIDKSSNDQQNRSCVARSLDKNW